MPAEHHLSFWHRDILWSSGFAFPGQMGRILYTSGHRCASFKTLGESWGLGAWIYFFPVKEMTLGVLHWLPEMIHSCVVPRICRKDSSNFEIGRMPPRQMGLHVATVPRLLCIKCLCWKPEPLPVISTRMSVSRPKETAWGSVIFPGPQSKALILPSLGSAPETWELVIES